jgi:hypothetical protein
MEASVMKASLLLIFSIVALAVTLLVVEKAPLNVAAQDLPPVPGGPPQLPSRPIPPPPDVKDKAEPASYVPGFVPPPASPIDLGNAGPQAAQAEQLRQLIMRLKELRRQEKDITEQIQRVVAAQKKSLEDAQDELRQLGIDGQRVPPTFLDKDKGPGPSRVLDKKDK